MTNQEIVAFFNERSRLKSKTLPMQLAFALSLNYKNLQANADAYNEQFNELKTKYDVTVDGKIKTELMDEFNKEIDELLSIEMPAENVKKVNIETLEKCDLDSYDSLTVEDLDAIGFMIEEL